MILRTGINRDTFFGWIANVSDSTNITFGYDNANRLTTRGYPNGVNTSYEYDGMSRPTRLKDAGPAGILFDRQYSYNSADQISQIVEPNVSRIFAYDNINRLISVTNSVNENESYSFDAVGNRTSSHRSSSYGYMSFNKLTSTNTATYNYDPNGNMVSKAEGSNFWRYTYDYENRLGSASTRKQSVRYKYDALGRRVSRVLGSGKENTKFIYDGLDVLIDDDSGTLTKYINGEGIDNKLRQTTGSTASYFLTDHLGSTNGLADSTGALTSQTAYDSFGNPSNASFTSRYQFTGREYDSFSGLQYSRARFYDPNLGRFISEDPIGFYAGDINLYGYVKNRPISRKDPTGLDDADIAFRETDYYKQLERQGNDYWNYQRSLRKPDMCGPAGRPILSWLVPDSVSGPLGPLGNKNDLHVPCENHDNCVGTCGKTIEQCRLELKKDIEDICNQQGGPYLEQCKGYADKYYKGVTDYYWGPFGLHPGQEAYDSAQEESGCVACKLPPPPRDPCTKFGDWRCK